MALLFRILTRSSSWIKLRNLSVSTGEAIKTSKIGNITCIGLNRPQYKNSLNLQLLKQLQLAIESFEADSSSPVAVLYGEQGNFACGLDPNEMADSFENIQELLQKITETFPKKPLVAVISGYAAGPGFELALWCDFRVVEETAVMAAYARNHGFPLNDATAKRLYALVGFHRALDWVLTGRSVKAKEALDCGIATRTAACGAGLGQGVTLANSISNMPQACLKADRATLLSLSDKFSSDMKKIILEEKEKNIQLALKEFKDGVHITKSGDVRRKEKQIV